MLSMKHNSYSENISNFWAETPATPKKKWRNTRIHIEYSLHNVRVMHCVLVQDEARSTVMHCVCHRWFVLTAVFLCVCVWAHPSLCKTKPSRSKKAWQKKGNPSLCKYLADSRLGAGSVCMSLLHPLQHYIPSADSCVMSLCLSCQRRMSLAAWALHEMCVCVWKKERAGDRKSCDLLLFKSTFCCRPIRCILNSTDLWSLHFAMRSIKQCAPYTK